MILQSQGVKISLQKYQLIYHLIYKAYQNGIDIQFLETFDMKTRLMNIIPTPT